MKRNGNSLENFNHVDLLFPSRYLKAGDLQGREVTVVIANVEPRHELVRAGNAKDYKPLLHLRTPGGREIEKALICNKTNAVRIAAMYGPVPMEWIGKAITLRAEPEPKSATGEAVRVKPERPRVNGSGKQAKRPATPREPEPEPPHDETTGEVESGHDYGPPPWDAAGPGPDDGEPDLPF